ncbi:STAS domain-containing protein [Streptomyces monticola]|uniref:STAS domain-containing protein n=1 Tax=Streptomyces monticola TaxID=2666263 RepID=A0ABW2JNK7_9ACTN
MNTIEPVVVALGAKVDRASVPRLCEQVRDCLERTSATELICDASALTTADLGAVEALARLRLTARRAGARLRIRDPSPDLCRLLLLVGLVETLGEIEEGEPAVRVQERVEADDLPP